MRGTREVNTQRSERNLTCKDRGGTVVVAVTVPARPSPCWKVQIEQHNDASWSRRHAVEEQGTQRNTIHELETTPRDVRVTGTGYAIRFSPEPTVHRALTRL